MLALATVAAVLALAQPSATVPPPPQPGPWQQLGQAVSARAGKWLHFARGVNDPVALGIVVSSASRQPIRVTWWTYCEVVSDDEQTQEHQAAATGVGSVVVYPPVLDGATRCYVSVNARTPGAATTAAAFFH